MRIWMKMGIGLMALALIAGVGYLGFRSNNDPQEIEEKPQTGSVERGDVLQTVSAPGQLVYTHQQELSMQVEGRLEEILVQPGDTVETGQVLARMGGREGFEVDLATARVGVWQAQQALDELIANAPKVTADAQMALLEAQEALDEAVRLREAMNYPRASQTRLDGAEAEYQLALSGVALAQGTFDALSSRAFDDPERVMALQALTAAQAQRDQALATLNWLKGRPTDQDIAEADAAVAQAQAALDSAQRSWERVQAGPDTTALELANAKLAEAQALYNQAESAVQHLELIAPFNGVVIEVNASASQTVSAATPILTLVDPYALEAQVTVVEEDFSYVIPGQNVSLFFDAQPEAEVYGKVARIIPKRTGGDRPLYPVYITVDNPPAGLVAGMTTDASIIIDNRTNVLVLPKAVVRARSDGTAQVYVWVNGKRETREIRIGLIGDLSVEVLEGLQEGDEVVAQ